MRVQLQRVAFENWLEVFFEVDFACITGGISRNINQCCYT